jgi:PAS domain S-box-containing protein
MKYYSYKCFCKKLRIIITQNLSSKFYYLISHVTSSEKQTHQKILDSLGDAVLVIDAENYTILDANNQATITYNSSTQDIIGKTCHQITHQKNQPCPPNTCPIHTALKTMKPCTVEHYHLDTDGNKHITEITVLPLLTEEKNTVVHISRDITERKLLVARIEEDERRYHALFEQAPLGILMVDPESLEAVEFNELAHTQLVYTRQEFSKLTVLD